MFRQFKNSADRLDRFGESYDPYRNARNVKWCPVGSDMMQVTGIQRDDSSIPADRLRARVCPLSFDVLVPESVSMGDLQAVILQQTRP